MFCGGTTMMGGPAVWDRGDGEGWGQGTASAAPKAHHSCSCPKTNPCDVAPLCPAAAPSGVAHAAGAGRAPALTLHKHTGGVGDGALLTGSMAGVSACTGTLHDSDAQCPVPHLQRHQARGMATKGQDTLRNVAL